jgi:hypothetical protein
MISGRMLRFIGAASVPVFIALIIIIRILAPKVSFEIPFLIPILNTALTGVASLIIAYFSARSYTSSGFYTLLLLGCGTLMYGLTSSIGGWLEVTNGGSNTLMAVQNTGAFIASILHLACAGLTLRKTSLVTSKHRALRIAVDYLIIIIFAVVFAAACLEGMVPPFYIGETGPTLLRRWVLGTASILFSLSSILFMKSYFASKSTLLYWYSLGLAMISVALCSFYLQHTVGDAFGWTGRTAQYVGSLHLFVAVLTTLKRQNNTTNRGGHA